MLYAIYIFTTKHTYGILYYYLVFFPGKNVCYIVTFDALLLVICFNHTK